MRPSAGRSVKSAEGRSPLSSILLVEDNSDLRLVMEHILLDEGYEVDVTGTMADGCELLGRHGYDLVIADALLPDGTGMVVVDKARERAVRAIIVTGYCCALAGETFDRYQILQKPVPVAELIETVKRAVGGSMVEPGARLGGSPGGRSIIA
jgi:DNA-binding NtrC family response regulator